MRSLTPARRLLAALRMLLVLSVVLGVAYPLAITAIAQLPGLRSRADGSLLTAHGRVVGSSLVGQAFTDSRGRPLTQYFQSRPSAGGYDPTATGASNLGPESIVDVLPDPATRGDAGTPSLLTQVCSRSVALGRAYGVDGSRPYCTRDGVGAVLAVFSAGPGYAGAVTRAVSVNQACPAVPFVRTYRGVRVACARFGQDWSRARIVAVRGTAPAPAVVPADAVTASGSGIDPDISPAYARLQERVVARRRGVPVARVVALVTAHTSGRGLGFLGAATVNVVELNAELDARYPLRR